MFNKHIQHMCIDMCIIIDYMDIACYICELNNYNEENGQIVQQQRKINKQTESSECQIQ